MPSAINNSESNRRESKCRQPVSALIPRHMNSSSGQGSVAYNIKWIVGHSCPCPLCPLLACHCPCELQVWHMHGSFWVWVGSLNMIFNHSEWKGIVGAGREEMDGGSM